MLAALRRGMLAQQCWKLNAVTACWHACKASAIMFFFFFLSRNNHCDVAWSLGTKSTVMKPIIRHLARNSIFTPWRNLTLRTVGNSWRCANIELSIFAVCKCRLNSMLPADKLAAKYEAWCLSCCWCGRAGQDVSKSWKASIIELKIQHINYALADLYSICLHIKDRY